ncbi:MAG: hypothetical protein CML36_02300 [Rhodobacteraceae bacterium]|nr:hypothetical protein [Paracoccaceae bacterium]OUU62547.1 MAG: hypothetical protein CBC22_04490 [Alphaproteobacteria bacterium TMED62]
MIILRTIKNFFFKTKLYNYYLSKNSIEDIAFTPKDAWPGDPVIGDQLVQGCYILANKKIYAPDKLLWQVSNKSTYWVDEVHSFSWLRHLKARSGSLARKHARYLILEWLKIYENWDYTAWELEVLSRRISAWVTNYDFLLAEKDERFAEILFKNLFKQIKFLRNQTSKSLFQIIEKKYNLEDSSIKKIKILRGLILSSICFESKIYGLNNYIKILEKELKINFNIDGLHESKSPSTHLEILGDLVTIREAIVSKQIKTPLFLDALIKKAAHALKFFRTPAGNLAIFNGSKQESKFLIDKILNQADGKARGRGPISLSKSGYEKIVCQGITVFVDTHFNSKKKSSKAPHSMQINIGKTKLFGSCGTIYKKDKKWKDSLLSASAHSALILENSNAFYCDELNDFTFNKRYQKNGSEVVFLKHDGYKKKFSAICSRTIEVNRSGKNIAVLDHINSDKLLKFHIRIHLNPKIKTSLSLDKRTAILIIDDQGWNFSFQGDTILSLEPSIFVQDNGQVKKTNQLILYGETLKENTEVLWGFTKN